jgi:hypothetical protein
LVTDISKTATHLLTDMFKTRRYLELMIRWVNLDPMSPQPLCK